MTQEIKAPQFPESVAEGTIAKWHKKENDTASRDEVIVEIETDKIVLEVVAPADGKIVKVFKGEGDTVQSQENIATFASGAPAEKSTVATQTEKQKETVEKQSKEKSATAVKTGPAARRILGEQNIHSQQVNTEVGRITKQDALNHISKTTGKQREEKSNGRIEKRLPMTRLRASLASRLVKVQQETAMLTTFNEVNMKPVMTLRKKYKDQFAQQNEGSRLGFMGFFVKAACEALKRFPSVNASIDGNDLVYHGYIDIGVAVSTERGLLVPIIRDADHTPLSGIENAIREFGQRANEGKIQLEELQGGTFTISNGGVFGSLWSTPILNPPQTAILGMHTIQERVMAVNGEMVILPMMYLALTYDHRVIDGKEAVQFLVTIKNIIEDPARVLIGI